MSAVVRDRSLHPAPVRGQRSEWRPVLGKVAVVDRNAESRRVRHANNCPKGISEDPDLGALARLVDRPPGAQPLLLLVGGRVAQSFDRSFRVDFYLAPGSPVIHLDDVTRD